MTHNVPEKSSTKRDPDVNATDGETQTPKSNFIVASTGYPECKHILMSPIVVAT